MARFRVSAAARADLTQILETSRARWGDQGRDRYATLLADAMRRVADAPDEPLTRDRRELGAGIRSMRVRHARGDVRAPVHVLYFRPVETGLIEIVRVLHERMAPAGRVRRRGKG